MNLVFFGTGSFGLASLEVLASASSKHRVLAVVTAPDKPKGRHLKSAPSVIRQWAESQQIPILELKPDNSFGSILPSLRQLNADIFVVISFGALLPKSILDLPKAGSFNVHSSLLPRYRGAAPIRWAILNRDSKTGVTVIRMTERLDAGDILLQKETDIGPEEDAVALENRLSGLGAKALLESLDLLEKKKALFIPQDESKASTARKITKEDGHIVWKKSPQSVTAQIRAMAGWPNAFSFHQGKRILVLEARPTHEISTSKPGVVAVSSIQGGIQITALGGSVELIRLKLESKKALPAAEFLKGYPLKKGDILE